MEYSSYKHLLKRPRRLGQNLLTDKNVAALEASYAKQMNVVEFGAGAGMLTQELCKVAHHVTAIELDADLCEVLRMNVQAANLRIINNDFFSVDESEFKNADMLASNVPYALSAKLILWLAHHQMRAIICIQKEFALRMLAKPASAQYSRLSVTASLAFEITHVANVPATSFYPRPHVDSTVLLLEPTKHTVTKQELDAITMLMSHKNKTIKNAVVDSASKMGISKKDARHIVSKLINADKRPIHLTPNQILKAAQQLIQLQKEYAAG